jgi:hypothetical protein
MMDDVTSFPCRICILAAREAFIASLHWDEGDLKATQAKITNLPHVRQDFLCCQELRSCLFLPLSIPFYLPLFFILTRQCILIFTFFFFFFSVQAFQFCPRQNAAGIRKRNSEVKLIVTGRKHIKTSASKCSTLSLGTPTNINITEFPH